MARTDGHWPAIPTDAPRRPPLMRWVAMAGVVVAVTAVGVQVSRGAERSPSGAVAATDPSTASTATRATTAPSPAVARTASGAAPRTLTATSPRPTGVTPTSADRAAPVVGVPTAAVPRPVTLAFAGDVHFEGSASAAIGGDLGSAGRLLAKADLAFVNLETAITDRGTAVPKQYSFRAPARALVGLRKAGVDAVSLANNHGMDYGRVGLADTLAAGRAARLPIMGAGRDAAAANRPIRVTMRGVRISLFAATDVLDYLDWVATANRSGLASVKNPARLLAAVRAEQRRADVVVVMLHWGAERVVCPTARQRDLARRLAAAGADLVVGSHAHVEQPQTRLGRTSVKYGMGNFVWYSSGGVGARTGVFTVTLTKAGVRSTAWTPATIRAGRPQVLTGTAARQRQAAQAKDFARCRVDA